VGKGKARVSKDQRQVVWRGDWILCKTLLLMSGRRRGKKKTSKWKRFQGKNKSSPTKREPTNYKRKRKRAKSYK
jgi:hypothetical protein